MKKRSATRPTGPPTAIPPISRRSSTPPAAQVEDIRLIQRTKGLDYLNSDLRQTALARLEHPDSSLGELCQLLGGDLTRSGLNHRLQKISRIADSLREDEHPRV